MAKKQFDQVLQHFLLLTVILLIMLWQRTSDFNQTSFLNRLDFLFYDLKMKVIESIFPSSEVMEHVAIVDIDEASLKQEGRWPWSRSRLADLVQHLQDYGASVVAFDMVFSEPERGKFIDQLVHNRDLDPEQAPALESMLHKWQPDEKFANAISQSDVVLGCLFNQNEVVINEPPKHRLRQLPEKHVLIPANGFTTSIPVIQRGAISEGFVSTYFDVDGVMRKTPLIMELEGYAYPALSLSAVMSYMLVEAIDIQFERLAGIDIVTEIKVTDKPVNTDAVGRVLIPYKGHKGYVNYISAKDVFNKTAVDQEIQGKIVFVGTSAIGLSDLIHTPFGTSFPGVEVHAIVAENLLKISFPYRPVWSPDVVFFSQFLIALLLIVFIKNQKPLMIVFVTALVLSFVLGLNLWLWQVKRLDFPVVSTLILILFIFIWYLVTGFIKEFQREAKIKGMFSQYLPPAHMETILNAGDDFSMEGESKTMTVLFADIRGFTTISESLSAIELKKFLNEYLTPITEVIFRHGGTIDKYVGDMVMAFWGAPLPDPEHSEHAINAALEMQEVIEALSTQFLDRGLPKVSMGIGINTGVMNVGDMGSTYRKAYTVLGDAVNLGSRLESLTKFYGVNLLIGEESVAGNHQICFRFCDNIKVKGKQEAVKAYEPLGAWDTLDQHTLAQLALYNECITHYQQQQWDDALKRLHQLKQQAPDCKLYQLYIERIEGLRVLNLPKDWDGVFVHQSK